MQRQLFLFIFVILFVSFNCSIRRRRAQIKPLIDENIDKLWNEILDEFENGDEDLYPKVLPEGEKGDEVREPDFDYYHTTEDIFEEILTLNETCKFSKANMKITILNEDDPKIWLLDFNTTASNIEKNRVFIQFGQHAREMISVETGLYFIQQLCGLETSDHDYYDFEKQDQFQKLLARNHLQMVINSNPVGRAKVEEGKYCWRSNGNKIDPNRNWDFHWHKSDAEGAFYDSQGGLKPFSEVETRVVNRAIKLFNPHIYIDIHSGMKGLLSPFGFGNAIEYTSKPKYKNSLDILKELLVNVQSKICPECLVGNVRELLHYDSFGSSLDYNFVVNDVPISTCWEIYGDNEGLNMASRMMNQMRMLRRTSRVREKLKTLSKAQRLEFALKTKSELHVSMSEEDNDCFDFFNPLTEEGYYIEVRKWSDAILTFLDDAFVKDVKQLKSKSTNDQILNQIQERKVPKQNQGVILTEQHNMRKAKQIVKNVQKSHKHRRFKKNN